MVPNARFIELLADIEPSSTTKNHASSAHTGIRNHLKSHEDFKNNWKNDFLSGSYARSTSIRPRTLNGSQDRPDVDIIVVTGHSTKDAPEDVLQELRDALEDGYTVKRTNKRSVRVETSKADMDIVPVIASGTGYLIPCREQSTWLATNPPVHTSWSSKQNDIFDGRFKKHVKLLKWWRRQNPTSKRPKGFVLEVLTAHHAPQNETHFGEAFAQLLKNIHDAYSGLAKLNCKPTISDPAIPSNDILAKVTLAQWKEFLEKVRVHADYARKAQDEQDIEKATTLWRKIFGERFKSTTAPAKASNSLAFASASASASAGYVFPNTDATPKKPRGFA